MLQHRRNGMAAASGQRGKHMKCGVAIFFTDYSIGPVEIGTALEQKLRAREGRTVKLPL